MNKLPPPSTKGKFPKIKWSRRNCLLSIPILGGLSLLLIAGMLILFAILKGTFFTPQDGGEDDASIPVQVVKVTPTISASPLPPPSCETIISSGDVQVAASLPISLTVGDKSFPIATTVLEGENWTYPSGHSGAVTWVCGTVVNYVLGLESTAENKALLADMRPGDEIKLHLSNGSRLTFRFVEQQEIEANAADVFKQTRPLLTLIMEKENGTWQIAAADYVAETEQVQPPTSQSQPGQPIHVGDAKITVTRGHAKSEGENLSAGTMYYLVEFSIENIGSSPLNTDSFAMQLHDDVGNQYLISPEASAAGEYGPLNGEIAPGTTAQGTAGYLTPKTLAGPTLTWTFSPQVSSELRASVSIPYEGNEEETEPTAGQAAVTITDAFLDGDVLIIEGKVQNTGSGSFTVKIEDVSLTSSAGMGDLRMAAPPLPWTIEPDTPQIIELQYEKPNASTALLSLLGYSFEIQGLQ